MLEGHAQDLLNEAQRPYSRVVLLRLQKTAMRALLRKVLLLLMDVVLCFIVVKAVNDMPTILWVSWKMAK